MRIKRRFGVTILELVIVVAVLGILGSSVMIIIGRNSQGKTRDGIRKADLQSIGGAVNAYYFSNDNKFPAGCDGNNYCTSDSGTTPWITGLNSEMKAVPLDPKQTSTPFLLAIRKFLNQFIAIDTALAASPETYVSETTDGYLRYTKSTNPPDTSGTCGINTNPTVGGVIGQAYAGSTYYTYRSYLAFNTANIPDNATITGVSLNLTVSGNNTTTDFDLRARYFDWQNSLACADWVNPASGTIGGTYNTSVLPATDVAFPVSLNFSGINLTGLTQIMLTSDREENNTAPSGREDFFIYSAETSAYAPKLVVTYSMQPDLIPQNLSKSIDNPVVGDSLTFSGQVKNQGDLSAGASTVRFCVKAGTFTLSAVSCSFGSFLLVQNIFVPDLGAGATSDRLTTGSWTPTASGTYTSYVYVDFGNQVTESNESNNYVDGFYIPDQTFTVVAAPPPTPTADIDANGLDAITIPYNTEVNITWTSSQTTNCAVTNNVNSDTWSGTSNSTGESTGNLTSSAIYTLNCDSGAATDSVTVTVSPPPPAPGAICPYRYETTQDRQDFILWACLEVGSDEHTFNINYINDPKNAKAPCPKSANWLTQAYLVAVQGANSGYNFCFESR